MGALALAFQSSSLGSGRTAATNVTTITAPAMFGTKRESGRRLIDRAPCVCAMPDGAPPYRGARVHRRSAGLGHVATARARRPRQDRKSDGQGQGVSRRVLLG